jgi:lysophospholipase L1-like esterase
VNASQDDTDLNGVGDLCEPIDYAALGDSFSSGEGAPGPAGYFLPTGGISGGNQCHRSPRAYSQLLDDPTFRFPPQPFPINVNKQMNPAEDFLACSGSESINVTRLGVTLDPAIGPQAVPKEDVVPDNVTQLTRLELTGGAFVVGDQTDLVTVTIGGNDLGFSDIIAKCITTSDCHLDVEPNGMTLEQNLLATLAPGGNVRNAIRELMEEIKQQAPNAAIVFAGYPLLVSGQECNLAPLISSAEQTALRDVGIELNDMLAEEAVAAGIHFVPIRDRFENNLICSDQPWVNGIELPFYKHSFHPNQRGQAEYADAINDHLETLKALGYALTPKGLPANPAPMPPPVPLAAPATAPPLPIARLGTLEFTPVSSSCSVDLSRLAPGQIVRLTGSGFAPGENVDLRFAQPLQVISLPAATADAEGDLDVQVTVPIGAVPGIIGGFQAEGLGLAGAGVELITGLTEVIPSLSDDSDGDGSEAACDNCPALANADQMDSDGDGLGDACDACPLDPEDDFDGDGLCADVDPDPFEPPLICDDGIDNDGDGLIDLADPGCKDASAGREDPQCNDGIDNDGDAAIDLDDPQCGAAWDNREAARTGCGLGPELVLLLGLLHVSGRRRPRMHP